MLRYYALFQSLTLAFLLVSACKQEVVEEEKLIKGLELVYAAATEDGVVVGGLYGSVEPQATISVSSLTGDELASVQADDSGRFVASIPMFSSPTIRVQVNSDAPVDFRVRDAGKAIDEAVRASVSGVGYVPNDLLVIENDQQLYAFVVRSGDNAVGRINLNTGESTGVLLPDRDGFNGSKIPASPWFLAHDAEQKVFVTAAGHDSVYWIDLQTQQILGVIESAQSVVLNEDFVLQRPYDTNGDGILETKIRSFTPRFPQGLLVTQDELLVAYSGFVSPRLDAARPAVYVPGIVRIWNRKDFSEEPSQILLPYMNPQEITLASDGKVMVTCSGIIETSNGMTGLASDSGVAFIDPTTRSIVEKVDLGEFGASSTIDVDGQIWTASLLKAQVTNLTTGLTISLNEQPLDSVFRLTRLTGHLVAAASFNTDKLFIFDSDTGLLNPPPFVAPFTVGPGPPVFDGAQIVARRAGRAGVDYTGPDLYVLGGLASRIWSVETRKLLGP